MRGTQNTGKNAELDHTPWEQLPHHCTLLCALSERAFLWSTADLKDGSITSRCDPVGDIPRLKIVITNPEMRLKKPSMVAATD